MKKWFIGLFIIVSLSASMIPFLSKADQTPKFLYNKLTGLQAGESKTISVRNCDETNVQWLSSDESVIRIEHARKTSCTLVGVKDGISTITAYITVNGEPRSLSHLFVVGKGPATPTPVPEKITLPKIKSVRTKVVKKSYKGWLGVGKKKKKISYQCVQLSWKKVNDASGYEIYRYGNASKKWIKIKTITNKNTTKYILPELQKGKKVQIKVRAYKKSSSGTTYGKYSAVKTFSPKKTYEINGIIYTQKHNPVIKSGWYRFYSEDAFVIQNKYRKAKGCKLLEWDEDIYKMAQIRSKEISGKFSHTRPDGSACSSIIKEYIEANNCYHLMNSIYLHGCGENIAAGQLSSTEVMKDWKNSSGHYKNIITTRFTTGAISLYLDKNEKFSWESLFTES